ncbi:NAD-dependent protein deacetylase [Amycolatopsis panacis]|uniref:NAD-dependent protein deacetylase n=1 Tax=Amycolatopsis panacis TaxID=2340917 RepID=A0A419I7I5_9PSEU|nr:NAD-dependent protein deacetylase [Amycolatopsis panacis]RJQ87842.1 NAD-dependent protein deacetylase [Amycolatopsis panacis]
MRTRPTLTWAAPGDPLPRTSHLAEVAEVLADGRVLVLTGAGISTESGIPDYRGESGSLRRHTPMTYDEFTTSAAGRRRYWARSHLGWRTIARAAPNSGHHALAALRASGRVSGVITQNVDGLHRAAGTPGVVELHGNLDRVICLGCRRGSAREELDTRLRTANPDFGGTASRINPDGDVELAEEAVRAFTVVECLRCGGILKPDVVFFGENVPRARVERCYRLVDRAAALLVLGSSLTVMSGLRFVRHAAKAGKPVMIVNRGQTRGDEYASIRVDRPLGAALVELRSLLDPVPDAAATP